DLRVLHQRVDPGQDHIARRAPAKIALVDRFAEPALKAEEPVVAFPELRGIEGREREQISVVAVLLDLFLAQHKHLPIPSLSSRRRPGPIVVQNTTLASRPHSLCKFGMRRAAPRWVPAFAGMTTRGA